MRFKIGRILFTAVVLGLATGLSSSAQPILTTLYNFSHVLSISFPNNDGAYSPGGLVMTRNVLFGTASFGGTNANGVVFSINTDGIGFRDLHDFTGGSTNGDGADPQAGLMLSGGTLYGTTFEGGVNGEGTVFSIHTDGTSFSNLYNFSATSGPFGSNYDGTNPQTTLILGEGTLYGATFRGGSNGQGTIFSIHSDGTGFRTVHHFTSGNAPDVQGSLIIEGSTLFGPISSGGVSNGGAIFSVQTNGACFTNLHEFTTADGTQPLAGLTLSGNTLYGATSAGGASGTGTVFAINTNGGGFTNLYSFPGLVNGANSAGAEPEGQLTMVGNTLYGLANEGGSLRGGTVFSLATDGSAFTNLHNFLAYTDNTNSGGTSPLGGLVISGNTVYGMTQIAGPFGSGTVFALSLSSVPTLGISPVGNSAVLSWPSWATNYTLQTITDLTSTNWSVITNDIGSSGVDNVLTNSLSGNGAYFRLAQ